MSGTTVAPVPIRPKPAQRTSNSLPGANTPNSLVRKPRGGPVIFVNASDLNAEGEAKDNKRTVKRWAMLNRVRASRTTISTISICLYSAQHNSHVNNRATPAKAKFLSWDLSTPLRESKAFEVNYKSVKPRMLPTPPQEQRMPPVDLMYEAALNDPSRKLPCFADDSVKKMLEFYRNVGDANPDPTNSGHRMRLCNTAIYPMLLESRAAFCSLSQYQMSLAPRRMQTTLCVANYYPNSRDL